MEQAFDIVIVGGGIAGMALACALEGSSLSVAVIESGTLPTEPAIARVPREFDPRVSALTPGSQLFLGELGAWETITALGASPYRHMHVWDAEGTGAIDFDAREMQHPCLGHIVENRLTVWSLCKQLAVSANVAILAQRKVIDLIASTESIGQQAAPSYRLNLDDGSQLSANLVVAADGALSSIRRFAGFNTKEWDYQHLAIVTTVTTEKPHQQTAWQRFMPEGPLAFLPLLSSSGQGANTCSIVWSAQTALGQELAGMDDRTFCDALGRAFEYRLGRVCEASPRFNFPLRQRHATSYHKAGLVLVGDAAHTIHPLAGQGINLGLKDVKVLAEEIRRAESLGLAPGLPVVLGRYQRRRLADNLGMMVLMDGFKRLFAQRDLGVRWLRNTGMNQLNNVPAVKRRIMRQAMGL